MEFKLKGVTFTNEDGKDIQKILKKEIKYLKDNGELGEKYEGYTNKEIKEMDLNVQEYSDVSFFIKLEEDTYNNKPCVKIYIQSYNGDYIHVGYIPKKLLSEYNENKKDAIDIKGYADLTGGKYKHCVYVEEDYEEKCYVDTVELNYGLNIYLKFFYNKEKEEEKIVAEKQEEIEENSNKDKKETNGARQKLIIVLIIIIWFILASIFMNRS